LNFDPAYDTIPPDSFVNVTVTFNATDLDTGNYGTNLIVSSNDPDESEIQVPVSLTVLLPNRAPIAINDTTLTQEDTPVIVPVISNDSDPDGDALTISSVSQGTHGSVTINAGDSTVTYTPGSNYGGTDSFSYIVTDGSLVDTGLVSVTITPVNDPPYIVESLPDVSIDEDNFAAVIIPRLENYFADVDEGDQITFTGEALDAGLDSLNIGTLSNTAFSRSAENQNYQIFSIKRSMVMTTGMLKRNEVILNGMDKHTGERKSTLTNAKLWKTLSESKNAGSSDTTALVVYPTENFNGDIRIVVAATDDSSASVNDTLLLSVLPINDPPGAFVRLLPEDESIQQADSVVFLWTASMDVDGDTVIYTLSIQMSDMDTAFTTSDTILIINFQEFDLPADSLSVTWSVEASDGELATAPTNGEGNFTLDNTVGIDDLPEMIPTEFALRQNYPNPFNPVTTLRYDLPTEAVVRLEIYNLQGKLVRLLVNERQSEGSYVIRWNGFNDVGKPVPSGIYLYRIKATGLDSKPFVRVRKMVMVK
jgi:hypothetical protein